MRVKVVVTGVACVLAGAFLFLLTGCNRAVTTSGSVENTTEYVETRPAGEQFIGAIKEDMHTAFFDFRLESCSAKTYFDIGDQVYQMEDAYQFLVAKLIITNTLEQDIEMFLDDFLITWDEETMDYGYGLSYTGKDGYMEDTVTIGTGETIERKILFKVPKAESYILIYDEFYEDGYQGNSYRVSFDVSGSVK